MKNKFRKNEKGFALPLALLLLVVMTIMGITLVSITSGDIRANNEEELHLLSVWRDCLQDLLSAQLLAVMREWLPSQQLKR